MTCEELFKCPFCDPNNSQAQKLSNIKHHLKYFHQVNCLNFQRWSKPKENSESVEETENTSNFVCCGCFVNFLEFKLYKDHFEKDHVTEGSEETDECSMIEPDKAIIPSTLPLPSSSENKFPLPSAEMLMNQLQLPALTDNTACRIIDLLGYQTVSYGNEQENIHLPYFSSNSIIKRSLELQEQFPSKVMKVTPCEKENTLDNYSEQIGLPYNHQFIIQNSPYNSRLSVDLFAPLTDAHIDILNTSWDKKPYMKYATIQLLTGAILITKKQAILVNCLEGYSRIPLYDAHTEEEGGNSNTSIPTIFSQYNDLSIVKLQNDNSIKLVIGTQVSNFLVTSSLRIDDKSFLPELGPSTKHFNVSDCTRIYLSEDSIKKYNHMIEAKEIKFVLKDEIYNLKQVRSRFHHASTYTFSRGFSVFTHSLTNVPVTVFTAQDCRHIHNKEVKVASGILREVAWGVIGGNNKLDYIGFKQVSASVDKDDNGTVPSCVKSIEKMFNGREYLEIIDNNGLNALLEVLARFVSTNGITIANQKIVESIGHFFNS